MTQLYLTSKDGVDAIYELDEIKDVRFVVAKDMSDTSYLAGNGVDPDTVLMIIELKDGNTATYYASNWTMHFE